MARNHELPQEGGPDGDDGQDGHGIEVADDGSSLILCSPLISQRDSLVEIAETEYVSFNEAVRVVVEGYRSPLHQVHTIDDIDEGSESEDYIRKTACWFLCFSCLIGPKAEKAEHRKAAVSIVKHITKRKARKAHQQHVIELIFPPAKNGRLHHCITYTSRRHGL